MAKKVEVKVDSKKKILMEKAKKARLGVLKDFGTNAVVMGVDLPIYGRIPTGSLTLDLELGGGLPVGRIIQIAGHKSSGKSFITDKMMANAQETVIEWNHVERKVDKGREIINEIPKIEEGLLVGIIDCEGTKTKDWTQDVHGVDLDCCLYTNEAGAEDAFDMAFSFMEQGVKLLVIDSLDALIPLKNYDTDFADTVQLGIKPKLIGEALRKFNAYNNKLVRQGELPCTVILINQLRDKIGGYGNPETYSGGRAIEFYVSIDLRLRRGDWITEGTGDNKQIIGQIVKFKTEKNKTYKQQRNGSYDIYFDDSSDELHVTGEVDNYKSIILEGVAWGVIEKAGSWLRYEDKNLAQGADNTIKFLRDNNEIYEKIKTELFSIINREAEGGTNE